MGVMTYADVYSVFVRKLTMSGHDMNSYAGKVMDPGQQEPERSDNKNHHHMTNDALLKRKCQRRIYLKTLKIIRNYELVLTVCATFCMQSVVPRLITTIITITFTFVRLLRYITLPPTSTWYDAGLWTCLNKSPSIVHLQNWNAPRFETSLLKHNMQCRFYGFQAFSVIILIIQTDKLIA